MGFHAKASSLETCSVACSCKRSGTIAVVECHTILDYDGCKTVDEVKAVIAIPPCTTALEHVSRIFSRIKMCTKAIHITAISSVGNSIEIVVGITIKDEIITSRYHIYSDSHTIVEGTIIYHTMTCIFKTDTFTLGMSFLSNLYPDYLQLTENEIVGTKKKGTTRLLSGRTALISNTARSFLYPEKTIGESCLPERVK